MPNINTINNALKLAAVALGLYVVYRVYSATAGAVSAVSDFVSDAAENVSQAITGQNSTEYLQAAAAALAKLGLNPNDYYMLYPVKAGQKLPTGSYSVKYKGVVTYWVKKGSNSLIFSL